MGAYLGTMEYVHQDCMEAWFLHSWKMTCDLCNGTLQVEKRLLSVRQWGLISGLKIELRKLNILVVFGSAAASAAASVLMARSKIYISYDVQ